MESIFNTEQLILVDELDRECGQMEKQRVHELGLLHRAFSVFIFNSKGEMLLHQRADNKYQSGGLWTNACCGHPRFGEDLYVAMKRRLKEEMGLQCYPDFAFSFQYQVKFENGLTENELDHVFISVCDERPVHDKSEIKCWKYETIDQIKKNLKNNPSHFTAWFRICFDEVMNHFYMEWKTPSPTKLTTLRLRSG